MYLKLIRLTDWGMHGLATTIEGCVKIWAIFPPTVHNLDLFYSKTGMEHKFEMLAPSLEGCQIAVTTAGETLYLPPGYLHTVYTLKGGFLFGINWNAAADIEVAGDILLREMSSGITPDEEKSSRPESPFLRACSLSLKHYKGEKVPDILRYWCRVWRALQKWYPMKRDLLGAVEEIWVACKEWKAPCPNGNCKMKIQSHFPWFQGRS